MIEKLTTQFAIRSERTNSRAEQFNQDRIYIVIGRITPSSVPNVHAKGKQNLQRPKIIVITEYIFGIGRCEHHAPLRDAKAE